MGTHVGYDDVGRSQGTAQVGDRPLGADGPRIVDRMRQEFVEQLGAQVGMHQDLARCVSFGRAAPADAPRFKSCEQAGERTVDVPDQLDFRLIGGIDLGRLRVDVDDALAAAGVPRGWRVLHEVVPHADDEVGSIEAGRHVIARLQTDRHERVVAPVIDGALAHECGGDGHVEATSQRPQSWGGATPKHAIAGQDDRTFGARDEVRGVVDRFVRRLREVGSTGDQRDGVGVDDHRRKVFGQLDVGGPRLLQRRRAKGLADDLGDRRDLLHTSVPFRHGRQHPDDVDDLVRPLVQLLRACLTRDGDQRRVVEVGVRDARHEVGRAWSQRGHRDGRPAGEPTVHIGHERGALFVAGRHVANRAVIGQRVEDVHGLFARDREDVLTAFGGEAIDEQVGCRSRPRRVHGTAKPSRAVRAWAPLQACARAVRPRPLNQAGRPWLQDRRR